MTLDQLTDIDWTQILINLISLLVAFILTLPIGWDRERQQGLGFRTFPLVAVASCSFVLIGQSVGLDTPSARARLLAGLITGVGFLGGGAIVKSSAQVRGTSTAAAIWGTAAIGAAVAYRRLEIALVLAAVTFFTLRALRRYSKSDEDDNC